GSRRSFRLQPARTGNRLTQRRVGQQRSHCGTFAPGHRL
ncbi:MAG: hypothetical protein AVDCRST_MAG71-738, partial [uncultured Lysobacter sp.]